MKIGTLLLAFLLPILPVWAQVQEPLDLEKALQLGPEDEPSDCAIGAEIPHFFLTLYRERD